MKNSIQFSYCAFCAFILFSFSLVKYNGPVELMLANLEAYAANYSPNKIYLQTDRSTYALEDTVWFKTYMLDATYHFPSAKSKVVYVDIVNSNGDKVLDKKLYIENMGAASDFFIGREWEPGRYKLRAYTKFMLNQDHEFIYNKEIQIVDINQTPDENFISPDAKDLENIIPGSPSLDLKFFPESGDLVAGIDSRVAIKIENYSTDLGDVSGSIEDMSGNRVGVFKIYETGYGLAAFKPVAGKKYFAKLKNNPKIYPLPEVKTQGYNILANRKSDNVSIVISSNMNSGLLDGDILIHSRGGLIFHKKLNSIVNDSYGLSLNTKEMPTGVAHITFFDKDGIPRCERLFFIDNDLSESVIETDKSIYSTREKVDLSLSVINGGLKSFDCSVSVFEKSSLGGGGPSDNIKSWMLLNSDLRGKINKPNFYFEKSRDHQRSTLLDLVLMTHGWRRFTWEDMSQEGVFKDLEYNREQGLYVKGYTNRILNTKKPIKSNVMLNFFDNSFSQEEVVTGDEGRFEFGPFIIEDSITAIIQARRYNEKNKKEFLEGNRILDVNIDTPQKLDLKKPVFEESDNFDYAAYKEFINNNKKAQALKDQFHDMEVMLSEVVLTAKQTTEKEKINKYISEISYYGEPSNRLIINDQDRSMFVSVLDMLRLVPGVIVRGESVVIRGPSSLTLASTPLFLINGVPADLQQVSQTSPNEVWLIDVLKGADTAIFGSRGANGVIAIYTGRSPNGYVTKREPGIVDIVIKGFDKNRQFYSPDYSKNISSMYETDMRSTLYWNPYVILSKGEENSISFFTGDNAGNYVVTTEGLSENGEPIYGTYEFSVQ